MRTKVKGRMDLADALLAMGKDYRADPVKAVRSQTFINHLHDHLADDLESRLTRWARKSRGVYVKKEAKLLGVAKDKNVDVAVIDPQNGPLLIIGARSQMSSIGKNVPGYFEGVIGDAMALEERFPMSTGVGYRTVRGVFDQFAYMVVDFTTEPAELRDDVVIASVPEPDLSITTFVDRMVETFKSRVFTKNDFFL